MDRLTLMLDTTAISEFFKGSEEIKKRMDVTDELFVNPVVIGELIAGFMMGNRESKNRRILKGFLSSPRVIVLDIDAETSERYGAIVNYLRHKGSPIPTNDIWIAASAMQHGLRLLTSDKHYLEVTQILVDFYEQ
jgi:predicted nucleic acid-binding protein